MDSALANSFLFGRLHYYYEHKEVLEEVILNLRRAKHCACQRESGSSTAHVQTVLN